MARGGQGKAMSFLREHELLMIIIGEGKGQLNRKQGKDAISELSRIYSVKERATHTHMNVLHSAEKTSKRESVMDSARRSQVPSENS